MTSEEPVGAEVRSPGLSLQQDVDIADAGRLPGLQVPLCHHPELSPMEDDRGVGGAGVVKLAGQQVEADTEGFARNFPEHLTTFQYLTTNSNNSERLQKATEAVEESDISTENELHAINRRIVNDFSWITTT